MSMKELIAKAIEARKMAYTPYSHFQVGACLKAKNGQIFQGCNKMQVILLQIVRKEPLFLKRFLKALQNLSVL